MRDELKDEMEVFNKMEDVKVMFDVGARTDTQYSQISPEIEIHYFEPNKNFSEQLVGGYINNFGLSDKSGFMKYYPLTQSFIINVGKSVVYELKTLDEYAKNISRIDFIKIDAEGMDYRILLGGAETIKRVRYLQFEYWDGVRKFVELLNNFELFLIVDRRLYNEVIKMRTDDKKYQELLVKVDEDVINFIDKKLIPLGAGGNIFAKRKC
jgi:FkbM family methyltransferase